MISWEMTVRGDSPSKVELVMVDPEPAVLPSGQSPYWEAPRASAETWAGFWQYEPLNSMLTWSACVQFYYRRFTEEIWKEEWMSLRDAFLSSLLVPWSIVQGHQDTPGQWQRAGG